MELKPCPFCGKEPESQINIIGKDTAWCGNSSCRMNSGTRYTLDEWNTRPLESKLETEVTDLRAKLEIATEALRKIEAHDIHYELDRDDVTDVWHLAHEVLKLLEVTND